MTLPTHSRLVYLLAIRLASIGILLNAFAANVSQPPESKMTKGNSPLTVTVQEVERILADDNGQSDAKIARQLAALELTQRMSYAKLKSLEESVSGKKTRSALVALADASVFLEPAAADVLTDAPPDLTERQHIIALTVDYLGKILPKLPDFFATETIVRYDGDARATKPDDPSWREVGNSKAVATYRDGKEVVNPREWEKHSSHAEGEALITKGIFGPILTTVILDAARGEMTWARWERGAAGKLAVFRYRVPQNQSHYAVAFHSHGKGEADQPAGYHGEVGIDPDTGTILAITVQADLPFGSPILRGDILVEYGPVDIGGKTYTCPVRSVSISLDDRGLSFGLGPHNPANRLPKQPYVFLNDVAFGDYHLFRSNSRIIAGLGPPLEH